MKILHCADLHIDSRMNTNFDAEKRKKRKEKGKKYYSLYN